MTTLTNSALPDPYHQSVFYDGIPSKRLIAWVIDVALILIVMIFLSIVTLTLAFWLWPIFWVATSFIYRSLTIGAGSATLGMRMMNIELRGPTGARLTGNEAMMHSGIYLLCASFFLPQILSITMIVLGQRNQSLPDIFMGTAAINRPR